MNKTKEIENTRDKINTAFVAFKIGKITELEKDIVIKGYIEDYADWKIKECLPERMDANDMYSEGWEWNQCLDAIMLNLSNKDKK